MLIQSSQSRFLKTVHLGSNVYQLFQEDIRVVYLWILQSMQQIKVKFI